MFVFSSLQAPSSLPGGCSKQRLAYTRVTPTSQNLAGLPLNCPKCGRRMRYLYVRAADRKTIDASAATDADIHVYQCAEHGPFHFSRDIPVRPGD
jgi:hypothetical protein